MKKTNDESQNEELVKIINNDIRKLIDEKIPITLGLTSNEIIESAVVIFNQVFNDLRFLTRRDPSAAGSYEYVYKSYSSFKAIMNYRVANHIYYNLSLPDQLRKQLSRDISEQAKCQTMIEIHPAARIGKCFAIDHGVGTVIGETCEIGDECYLLQGVILGSNGISGNKPGKRHPTLGNNVQIGAFAKILGPVKIGNNVFISPNTIITFNVSDNSKVLIVNQLQLTKINDSKEQDQIEIYGIVPQKGNRIAIFGSNFKLPSIYIIIGDPTNETYTEYPVPEITFNSTCVEVDLTQLLKSRNLKPTSINSTRIKIEVGKELILLTESLGLNKVLTSYYNN